MFGDTDLPLALIMEEILGWEKKPGQKDEEEKENQQEDSVPKKFLGKKEVGEKFLQLPPTFYIYLK